MSNRSRAAEYTAAGGALYGAGSLAGYHLDEGLNRRGIKRPMASMIKDKRLHGAHVPYMAGRAGVRALQVTGIPLAAAGVYGMVKPKKTRQLSIKQDIVKPLTHAAAFGDAADRVNARQVGKSATGLSSADHERLARRKSLARNISLTSGTLGLTALGLRTPSAAASLSRRVPKVAKPLKRLAAKEPHATRLSNTLGVGAIGVGSAGSFNYARIIGTEAKGDKNMVSKMSRKAKAEVYGGGALMGTGALAAAATFNPPKKPKPAEMAVVRNQPVQVAELRNGVYETPFAREARVARQMKVARRVNRGVFAAGIGTLAGGEFLYQQGLARHRKDVRAASRVSKDDRFLRKYRPRISPDAERGYEYLRRGRNEARAVSGVATALGVGSATGTAMAIARKRYGAAALGAGATAINAATAYNSGKKAVRWEGHMKKIRNKAYERESQGVYGRGRPAELAKAFMLTRPAKIGLPYPKGTLRKPAMRPGSVRRTASGSYASFRGSYG